MTDLDPQPTVRLADPGALAAGLPHLLGFPPEESLVVVSLRGQEPMTVGLTARVDLPPPGHHGSLAGDLARSVRTDDPTAVVLVVVSEDDDGAAGLPHRTLVREAVLGFHAHRVPVRDALLVRRGRWWSYDCSGSCCAPGAGTPLPGGTSDLAVAAVVHGTVVEADRTALAARIAPTRSAGMAWACDEVGDELAAATAERGWDAVAEEGWDAVLTAVHGAGTARAPRLSDRQVARLAWGLRDADLRDRALTLALGESAPGAEAVWTELTRRAPAPLDAAPATLLAVSAWLRGDGALANVALDRALGSEPSYTLAGLLRTALDACLPPAVVRQVIREAAGPSGADR
ncbi:DUF4192 domain-containing protein [Modestobacter muralis]|uniref:DUF4192 domain-containing protein n=1 Tax=Modestobacter muralis TaxID=1608614 RepID=A0A6P0EU85_9ACTN|nr:DUF4192 domain-containing protein [Modestobacter muralis]NEK92838.1 DUF4192 domain-containing protein [Modestobacter muralis]NEN49605.1 DUF4192 domain-containing protein [Modestobacter muralis]